MRLGPDISVVASLIGDPGRCNMLNALLTGQALTAGELAEEAGVTLQTASFHIAKLEEGGLVTATKRGRHRYIMLAGPHVAHALESLMAVAELTGHHRVRPGPKDPALRYARVCYDHLAGDLGVHMLDQLVERSALTIAAEDVALGPAAKPMLGAIGLELSQLADKPRPCRLCMDWSARRWHLGGPAARRILERILDLGWARRVGDTRALNFSHIGEAQFRKWLASTAE